MIKLFTFLCGHVLYHIFIYCTALYPIIPYHFISCCSLLLFSVLFFRKSIFCLIFICPFCNDCLYFPSSRIILPNVWHFLFCQHISWAHQLIFLLICFNHLVQNKLSHDCHAMWQYPVLTSFILKKYFPHINSIDTLPRSSCTLLILQPILSS